MTEVSVPVLRNDESTLRERMTDNAYEQILPARYLDRNEDGEVIEEQEELFERVAKNISVAEAVHAGPDFDWLPIELTHDHFDEEDYGEYMNTDGLPLTEETARYFSYDELVEYLPDDNEAFQTMVGMKLEFQKNMENLKLMPNTPCLINAGRELQMLSACFVMDIDDEIRDIHEVAADAADIFQSGGGVGYPFSNIRPYGDKVGSTGGVASGPISFMNTLDQVCSTIAQGGVRRGAQMGVMDVSHPDIPFFIHAKNTDVSLAQTLLLNDPDDITNDDFSEALEEARDLIDDEGRVPEHLRNAAEGHLSNFNISVGISDEFMDAVQNDEEFTLINPRTEEAHIATEATKELYSWFDMGEYVEVGEVLSVPAQELWERIVDGAHSNGEPGAIYMDRVNENNTFDYEEHPEFEINATNPCGEEPLFDGDACNLAHINLSTVVDSNATHWNEFTGKRGGYALNDEVEEFLEQAINWDELYNRVSTGVNFLDNVVTMSDFPVENIDETVRDNRKIGLGIMGLAQLFIQLGVEYGSEESQEIARQLMKKIHYRSKYASQNLAEERGTFNNWEKSKWSNTNEYPDFIKKNTGIDPTVNDKGGGFLQRNHETTTIAPTGTTSQIANTSGGCEPIFSVCYFKNVTGDIQGNDMLVEFDSLFLKTLEENDIDVEKVKEEAVELMNNNEFDGPASIPSVPDEIGELFVTTNDLTAKEHASVQCALQEGVGSGISKTVNAPNNATLEDAKEAFEYIYENGGKSVTYYRDGSRTKQVQTTRRDNQDTDEQNENKEEGMPSVEELAEVTGQDEDQLRRDAQAASNPLSREAPKVASGTRYEINTGYGDMFVNIVEDEHGPVELIANVGKSGGTVQSMTEAIGRLVSKSLQNGVPPEDIIEQLDDIHSPKKTWDDGEGIESVPDGISVALERYIEDAKNNEEEEMLDHPTTKVEEPENNTNTEKCPKCGSQALIMKEGCETCDTDLGGCGYSKCS